MDLNLQNKRAVVCGSTKGIGLAAAVELANMGASVTLIARDENTLIKIKESLSVNFEQEHHYLVADFSDPADLKQKINDYTGKGIMVNILVNNTGGPQGGLITEASTGDFEKTFSQHLICNHILVQSLLPGMKQSGYGRIINIISTSVKQPLKGLGVSNTIRAAVANWSKTLAMELGPSGITVNNILPGATATHRLKTLLENKAAKTGKSVKELELEMINEIPLGRFAEPSEIANAIGFLASPAAQYISGINIPVDGGRTGCL